MMGEDVPKGCGLFLLFFLIFLFGVSESKWYVISRTELIMEFSAMENLEISKWYSTA